MVKYECVKAKSLLSKPVVADSWFHINRSLNAYRGCEHGCVYCDGMSEFYYVDNFTTHIRVKDNAPEVLTSELKREGFSRRSENETETLLPFLDDEDAHRIAASGPRRIVIGVCGGVSDGYQPAEEKHKVTRRVLETLLDFQLPAAILTKSNLVLRDLDILKEMNRISPVNVMFTITLHDDEQCRMIEPHAATTPDRFDALKEIRKAGLHGGVMAVPIIPFIGTDAHNMEGLAKEAKRVGAEFILFGGLTLKPGRQKDYFLNVIRKRFPRAYDDIVRSYSNDDKYGRPIWHRLPSNTMLQGHEVCKRVGISDRSVRLNINDDPALNTAVLGKLLDIAFYQTYLLGLPAYRNRQFHELAVKIERGVPDLQALREKGTLATTLGIDEEMTSIVIEVMDTGHSSYLENLLESASDDAKGDQVFTAFSDEQPL